MVKHYKQFGLIYTYIMNIILNYKHTLYTEVAYTNYLTNNLNTFIDKTPAFNSGVLFIYLFINKKPYYNSGLFLNESINPTSIGL